MPESAKVYHNNTQRLCNLRAEDRGRRMNYLGFLLAVFVFFLAGWGWGQWWSERTLRRDRATLERGRIALSMPMDPKWASEMMVLMQEFFDKAQSLPGADEEP